jgi:hypothetical protein
MIWLLVVSYVAVAALLLNLNLSVRAPLAVKALAIVLVSGCYVFTYFGIRGQEGWPTGDTLPESFRLEWITVLEPDKASGAEGEIFFWIRHLDDSNQPDTTPRAYRLPFSAALAEQAQQALEKIEGGETLNGFISRQTMSPAEGAEDTDQSGQFGQRSLAGDEAMFAIEFRDVPRPTLPPKAVPN